MSNPSGSLGTTHLLAYVRDGESAASIRALMHRQNVHDFTVEPGTAAEAAEYLKSHASPKTLIVEVPSSEEAPRLLDALADVVHPTTRVIVTGAVDTFSFYHWLMGLGIQDYLLSPFNEQQLASALAKGPASAAGSDTSEKTTRKVIAVIGARGGVGTTTIATNLAAICAETLQLSTALVDLDAQFGSVALSLDLEPSRGLRDALEKPDRIDTLFLERVMIKADDRLSLLSAEEPLSEVATVHPNAGELLLAALREKFPMTVVDMPRQLTPLTRAVLAQADHVILVAEPSLLSLRDALRLKDWLVDGLKRPQPLLVFNRDGLAAKQQPPRAQLSKHLGLEASVTLPFSAEIMAATANGDTLLSNSKLAALAAPLKALAAQLSGQDAAEEKRPRKGWLKGSK